VDKNLERGGDVKGVGRNVSEKGRGKERTAVCGGGKKKKIPGRI